ncbi:MAG TPA: hypothetical protein VH350_13000 [Candidatus Sulfotelmatobacter sp.]|jgi:hypothetical protein|nr:hypothetical protein [Candidatus Sulfotelmatobacter sp.]
MDRRRQQRVSVELPVVIWGVDLHGRPFTQPATVRTVSSRGGTLQGVCAQLKPGDVFDLQYQGVKTQFRVVWLGKHGSDMEGEVGIETLASGIHVWDFDPMRCTAAAGRG